MLPTSNLYHSVLFQWGFRDFRQTSVLCVILPNFISTNASVVSLARSITGRFRPANTFTFIFPGIFAYLHSHLTLKQQVNSSIDPPRQHCTLYYHVFHTRLSLLNLPNQNENTTLYLINTLICTDQWYVIRLFQAHRHWPNFV